MSNTTKLNEEQIQSNLKAFEAAMRGKKTQFWNVGDWQDKPSLDTQYATCSIYRPKPEPKIRPWKQEEVPVGALLKRKGEKETFLIVEAIHNDVRFGQKCRQLYSNLISNYVHSIDQGKTWQPCGVVE